MTGLDKKIKTFPSESGIYLFFNKKKELVYVGKATNLRARVRSYFAGAKTSRPIEQMIHQVTNIKIKQTDSVLEAIILEANYIKKFRPKYNVDLKDDKSWNYIVITKDIFPKVKTVRAHELGSQKSKVESLKYTFGPYPGLNTKATMRLLQRLFYISTCKPKKQGDPSTSLRSAQDGRPCLYHQMGQCLGVCTGEITPADYKKKVINPLVKFLRGNKKGLIRDLIKKMKVESKEQNFEEAGRLRNQIKALERIHDIALLNRSFTENQESNKSRKQFFRIEGYDISNLGDTGKVGSMVVFENNYPNKSQYRKFKIKNVVGQSDVDCLAEMLERRLKRNEWKMPDVFLIDGGKPQVNI
ncbi:GIY-YIG nuclease family protein, partial [Candidatus Falkowbacteria bacterium]|nr:GIY-YIG nuclease family protein [Candidatus Falkowbacteria bacterium]